MELYYIISFSFFVKRIVLTNWLHACKFYFQTISFYICFHQMNRVNKLACRYIWHFLQLSGHFVELYYIISSSFFVKRIVLTNWLHACTSAQITFYIWHFLQLSVYYCEIILHHFLFSFLSNRIVLTNWLHACKQKKI